MRARRQLIGILAVVLSLVALALWYARSPLSTRLGPWLDLKKLERQAKENLDATELQQWAVNLMAQHSGEREHWDEYGGTNFYSSTNFPSGLRKIGCFSDGIAILTNDRQGDVAIFGLHKGGPFLMVGVPSSTAPTDQTFIQWKPGIYFVGDLPRSP